MSAPAVVALPGVPPPAALPGRRGKLIRLSDVKARPITWLVPGRIPNGAVTLLAGRPGKGKSQLCASIGASLTTQGVPWILVGAEDGLEDTVRPRVEAAGGNPDLTYAFVMESAGEDDIAFLPDDIDALGRAVKESGAGLVVIDPMAAHLAPDLNSHNDHSVRQALRPLTRMAQTTGAAIIVVSHFRKGREGSPLDWVGGSTGVGGSVRSALLFGEGAADDELRQEYVRYLVHIKLNGGPLARTMRCEIMPQRIESGGRYIESSYVKFVDEIERFYAAGLA